MASVMSTNQEKLSVNGYDNPSTLQNAASLESDSYGTFINAPEQSIPPSTTTVSSHPYALASQQPSMMYLGGCPACKTGMLETDFTYCGLCCAIFFFPIGIICCLKFRQRRCNFCGSIYN